MIDDIQNKTRPAERHIPLDMNILLSEDITILPKDQIEIEFQDLQYSIQLPKKKGEKTPNFKSILKGCSGVRIHLSHFNFNIL